MGDNIEVKIFVDSPLISDLHETVESIINQIDKKRLGIYVVIENSNNLNISNELKRLQDEDIKVSEHPSNARFAITLHSGEIISRSFLYKAKYYLQNNATGLVCPEYTFYRIENSLIIATIFNDQMLLDKTTACLIDLEKTISSPRVSIIKDTCAAKNPIREDFLKHLKKLRKENPYFDSPIYAHNDTNYSKKPSLFSNTERFQSLQRKFDKKIKPLMGRSKLLKKLLEKDKEKASPSLHSHNQPYISSQMRLELDNLACIKYNLKGYMSMKFKDVTYEVFKNSEKLFTSYIEVSKQIEFDDYQYIMILPWLISGGIDLFAINYIKTIAELNPNENILIFLTNGAHKSFCKEELSLPSNVTLVNLPRIFNTNEEYLSFYPELLFSFINAFSPKRLHVIASKAGYDCMIKYGDLIRRKDTKVIFSSYNYLTGQHGEYIGYTVQELPNAYRKGDIITTDNMSSKNLWSNHYGFESDDILIHHQLFDIDTENTPKPSSKNGIKILWAAHVRPEKNPDILPSIAEQLANSKVEIDCYGLFSPMNWPDGNNPLETNLPNLHYKGAYNNFFKDINLKEYDLFLYTSHADGTPNIIIEAALAGLPIVASKIGGIPDALKDNAILVEDTYSSEQFVTAIRQTLSNQSDTIQKANKLQEELSKKHCKDNFIKQVKEMLERSK